MKEDMKNQFKIKAYINKQRGTGGKNPVCFKITYNYKRAVIVTRVLVNPDDWDAKKEYVKMGKENYLSVNTLIDNERTKINRHFLNLLATESRLSATIIKHTYLGKPIEEPKPVHKTILDAFEYHQIKMMDKVKIGNISKATHTRYKITKDKVVTFMEHQYQVSDMELPSIRLRFISEFEHFLLTVQKIQSNTAHKYIKNVKAIMNLAVGLDWIPSNPFNLFKCSYTAPERDILNHEELYTLQHKVIENERLAEVRDVFVFCCYTGFAYSDIYQFEKDAVMRGLDNELWLSTNRQKTGTKESVPLLPVAIEIIEKYQDHKYCVKYNKLLPVNSNQKYNAYLSEIATICNIKKHLTSHIARHTFATTVTLANGVPIETVSSMLGHTSIRTTQIYAKVVEKKVSEDMQLLRAKLFGLQVQEKEKKIG
jgi:site-specific recombinase XerD